MKPARNARRSRPKSRGKGAKATSNPKASAKQVRYIEWLREHYDPLKVGSEIPALKEKAGAEIARLLILKAKYETMTRQPHAGQPKALGQHRYPGGPRR